MLHWAEEHTSCLVRLPCNNDSPALQDGFSVETTSGQTFEDVDLSDKEWTEYDEKLGTSVEIMDLQWRFDVHK